MIPVLYALDLEHKIILKYNRCGFKYYDRYAFLNSNCDRWEFKFQILLDRNLNWPFMYLVPKYDIKIPIFNRTT